MSDSDFSAAHSMDTQWFAVDRDGHVALFRTGEAGPAPASVGYQGEEYLDLTFRENSPLGGRRILWADDLQVARLGLFSYEHVFVDDEGSWNWIQYYDQPSGEIFAILVPFRSRVCPVRPLHVDELPLSVRELVSRVGFESVCFADTSAIQLFEHLSCRLEDWHNPCCAYLLADGWAVRPIPGREEAYHEFLKCIHEDSDLPDGLHFETEGD
jgi:hypothetical protein